MWQRFTECARRVVFYAQEEAGRLGENYVSTEHLLLGIVRSEDSRAIRALKHLGVSADRLRSEIEKQVTRGDRNLGQDMQLTPRAKRVIDLAYDEARDMGHNYIGTEHILIALVREGEGLAGRVLEKLVTDCDAVRGAVAWVLSKESGGSKQVAAITEKTMKGKDLIEIACLSRVEIDTIFATTKRLKENIVPPEDQRRILEGKTLAMIFEKPSLRTRVTFETGIFQLGGHGIYLQPSDIQLGVRETIADAARNLHRWVDIIMARTFKHETVTELAKYADVPVINALSDLEHPCQALADFYTILEHKGTLAGLKLAFVGDGNNVAHSLMLLAAKVGMDFAIACPEGYCPDPSVTSQAIAFAKETGSTIAILHDPSEAAQGADVVYTDVWASMGQEGEAAERAQVFAEFQVSSDLMKCAKEDAIFEHCLPAHRGCEVTDEVIDSPRSVVFDEAENRLHVQKAIMAILAG